MSDLKREIIATAQRLQWLLEICYDHEFVDTIVQAVSDNSLIDEEDYDLD